MIFKNTYSKFEQNVKGSDYVVGDIHGEYDILFNKLFKMRFDFENDRLFSVGDLIDRGPRSYECLNLIYEPWFFPVIGNHEMLFLNSILTLHPSEEELWSYNGGSWHYDYSFDELSEIADYIIKNIPFAIEIQTTDKNIGIVHAEPLSDWNIVKEQLSEEIMTFLTWSRKKIKSKNTSFVENIDCVYVGHTILDAPVNLGNVRYIDTGSFYTKNIHIEKIF